VCVDDCFVPTTTRPCDDEDKMCCLTERENEKGDKDVALKVKLTKSVVSGVFQSKSLDIYYIFFSKKAKSGYNWLVAIISENRLYLNC
jgi:hypothetical protein